MADDDAAPEEFACAMETLGVGEGTRVVVYDRSNHAWAAECGGCFAFAGSTRWCAERRMAEVDIRRSAHLDRACQLSAGAFSAASSSGAHGDEAGGPGFASHEDTQLVNALSPEEHRGDKSDSPVLDAYREARTCIANRWSIRIPMPTLRRNSSANGSRPLVR